MTRLSNENDELLNSYFDGECNAVEKKAAEELLKSSSAASVHLQSLSTLRTSLKSLNQQRVVRDLSQSVIAQARQQARALGLEDHHHVLAEAESTDRSVDCPVSNSSAISISELDGVQPEKITVSVSRINSNYLRWTIACCAVAASLLIAVLFRNSSPEQPDLVSNRPVQHHELPGDSSPAANPFEQAIANNESANLLDPDIPTRTVGKTKPLTMEFLRLVVDISVVSGAWNNNSLGKILDSANIRSGHAILADQPMIDSLEKSLMIMSAPVTKTNEAQTSRVALLFVEAPAISLDKVLSVIYARENDFPQVALNIAFARPDVELFTHLKAGVDSLPKEFMDATDASSSTTIGRALPIVIRNDQASSASDIAQFTGTSAVPRYVSRTVRSKGWSTTNSTATDVNSKSEAIFVIREQLPQ